MSYFIMGLQEKLIKKFLYPRNLMLAKCPTVLKNTPIQALCANTCEHMARMENESEEE